MKPIKVLLRAFLVISCNETEKSRPEEAIRLKKFQDEVETLKADFSKNWYTMEAQQWLDTYLQNENK